jgi:hypothetical protein
MNPGQRFYVRTGEGVSLAFCTPEHAFRWVTALPDPTLELTTLDVTNRAIPWCEHSSWCGELISPSVTGACRLHDGDCPEFSWEATLCGVRAVQSLTRRAGRPLPPRAFVYLADAAENQILSGEWPSPADLARRVWDVRVDWLSAFS